MNKLAQFNQHRPLLFSIAYNMLGSAMDAEDIVQDVYLRWIDSTEVESPKAYLSTIATNLCINHLQSAQVKREEYFGPWLPEPIVTETNNPEQTAALSETLSLALLVMLESCTPQERAAFILRQLFDYEYAEIATMLNKTEAACRQLVSRTKQRVKAQRHLLLPHTQSETQQIAAEFLQACATGNMPALLALLDIDCVLHADGGGKVPTAIYPVRGADKVARFMLGVTKKAPQDAPVQITQINNRPGIIGYVNGRPALVIVLETINGKITHIYNILNPDKLHQIPSLKSNKI